MKRLWKKRAKFLFILVLAAIFSVFGFFHFRNNVRPVIYTYCDALISSLGEECINSSAADVVALYEYSDFIRIEKGVGDRVELIETVTSSVNAFVRSLALRCENALNALGVQEVEVPLGAFTGSVLLSTKGPKVKVDITFFSSVKCDFITCFESVGVNQTRHSVYAKLDVSLNTVLPISEHELHLSNSILVAENVIIGEIPNVFVGSESGINYLDLIP